MKVKHQKKRSNVFDAVGNTTLQTPQYLRDMTEQENITLKEVLVTLPVPRKRYLKAALNTAVFWIFSLAGFCILWFIGSLTIAAFTSFDIGISSPYAIYIFASAIMAGLLFALSSTKNWLAGSVDDYALVKADLDAQKINAETYHVNAVKCFKEPELGGLLYFLLLQHPVDATLSVRAIYDYESQNKNADTNALLLIRDKITICTAPCSALVVDNLFTGNECKEMMHDELTASPEQWPEANSWQTLEWARLASTFNPQ